MADKTAIEWADSTVNFAWGCTKVSEGCDKCYMFRLSNRFNKSTKFAPRKMDYVLRDIKKLPLNAVVFTNSMTDTFHEDVTNEDLHEWFKIMGNETTHQWIILTKRINRAFNYFAAKKVPDNCWIGTSIESKTELHRLRKLKRINARIKFVSFEPLLEDIGDISLEGIDWAIVGGESDFTDPRPFKDEWALHIRDICRRDKVAFFYKQSGGRRKNQIGEHSVWGTNYLPSESQTQYLAMPEKHLLATKLSTLI